MGDPTKFPQMHIAESVFNRIMNMKAELLPVNIPTLPEQPKGTGGGTDPQKIQSMIDNASSGSQTDAIDTAVQGTNLDAALGTAGDAAALPGAGGSLGSAAGIDAGMLGSGAVGGAAEGILGGGAAGAAGAAGGAAGAAGIAGTAVASGSELLPLVALA